MWNIKESCPAGCTIADQAGREIAETYGHGSHVGLIAEAPAMLAALRETLETLDSTLSARGYAEGSCSDQWSAEIRQEVRTRARLRAILARIDGTPTDEADDFGAGAAANLSRRALAEAAGEALALAGPTGGDAQGFTTPAGIIAAAQGYVSDPGQWNPLTPAQVAYLLALSGISHGPIADDPAD